MYSKIRKIADNIKQAAKPTDEEAKELLNKIDWKSLEDMISAEIGAKITLKIENKPGRYDKDRITFKSNENLADKAGVFSNAGVYKELRVEDFGTNFMDDGNFIVNVNFYWEYSPKAGLGNNGCGIFRAWFDFKTNKWNKVAH